MNQLLATFESQDSNRHTTSILAPNFHAPEFFDYDGKGKIDGKEGPREWLRSFQGAVLIHEEKCGTPTSETMKKLEIRRHLKGSAGNWFETYEDRYTTYGAFVTAFSAFYGLQNLQVELRHSISRLKQGPKEDLRTYNNK
jgi:hypothetical protein